MKMLKASVGLVATMVDIFFPSYVIALNLVPTVSTGCCGSVVYFDGWTCCWKLMDWSKSSCFYTHLAYWGLQMFCVVVRIWRYAFQSLARVEFVYNLCLCMFIGKCLA